MTLLEAWPGLSRANRGQPVHVVDWPADRTEGHALCGRALSRVSVWALGWAPHVGVPRCTLCDRRLDERRQEGGAKVIPLAAAARRSQRR